MKLCEDLEIDPENVSSRCIIGLSSPIYSPQADELSWT